MSLYAAQLRNEIAERAVQYARDNALRFRRSHYEAGSVVFIPSDDGARHGNFHPASYRRILRRPMWRKRLGKALTVTERLRDCAGERRLCELDSCCSSDALLMNIFCHPHVARSPAVLGMLGIQQPAVPIFGWRARVPLIDGKFDRTEVDMKLGSLLVESKLTEGSFESCAVERMNAYADFREVFRLADLPRYHREYRCYQLLRNVLAAKAHNASFCLITDARRKDLIEDWFRVLSAIRPLELRVACKLLTWQELAEALPTPLRRFLDLKYGIGAGVDARSVSVGY